VDPQPRAGLYVISFKESKTKRGKRESTIQRRDNSEKGGRDLFALPGGTGTRKRGVVGSSRPRERGGVWEAKGEFRSCSLSKSCWEGLRVRLSRGRMSGQRALGHW